MINRDELIKIGIFNKPHGIHGELSFTFTDDIFDRTDCPYLVCGIDGIYVPFFIEEYRFRSDTTALVKLEDVDSDADARMFTNLEVYFPKSFLTDGEEYTAPGDYFIGFTVVEKSVGEVGTITGINDTTANVLFEVERRGEELLIPVSGDFILSVDENNKTIHMDLPDGLLSL